MDMFLAGAVVMWFICSIAFVLEDDCLWADTMDWILRFPCYIMWKVLCLLFSPFTLFYLIFLRHTIKPVDSEAVEKAKVWEHSKHLFGSIYICFDKKAKRLGNKVFLFKVKPPVISNKADSPKYFRIGVDN